MSVKQVVYSHPTGTKKWHGALTGKLKELMKKFISVMIMVSRPMEQICPIEQPSTMKLITGKHVDGVCISN